jgi:hypothetical protein
MGNFFTDTISKDSRFHTTQRVADLNLLEPMTRQNVLAIIAGAKALGIEMIAFETYRSQERQQTLFNQHVTKLKAVGVHHYGLACDIVKIVHGQPSWDGDFSFLGKLAHANGMIWGGDWGDPAKKHDFLDTDHVQRCTIARQNALFGGQWYPDDQYDPYAG